MKLVTGMLTVGLGWLTATAFAADQSAFDQMKQMEGSWAGMLTRSTGEVVETRSTSRLISDGNTMVETLVEDGVEMLTTYSDKNGELVVQHYCALGTEPIFRVSNVSESELSLALDESASGLHAEHESFVTSMQWAMQGTNGDSMLFTNTIMLDGQMTENTALLTRVE